MTPKDTTDALSAQDIVQPLLNHTLRYTWFRDVESPRGRVECATWSDFAQLLTAHEPGTKQGSCFSVGTFDGDQRKADNVATRSVVALDIEQLYSDSPLPPTPGQVVQRLQRLGWAAVVYTSHSHMTAKPRYRVVVSLAADYVLPTEPQQRATARDVDARAARMVADKLDLSSCLDASKCTIDSVFYLPRHPDGGDHFAQAVDGVPLDWSALLDAARIEWERDEAAYEAARAQRPQRRDGPISRFNRKHAVAALLDKYGYKRHGPESVHWRSPNQTTGSFATRTYDDRWVSLSGSDIDAGLGRKCKTGGACSGDAFDLYCHYEHGSDLSAAFASLRPTIVYLPTAPVDMALAGETALIEADLQLFQQNGRPVRVMVLDKEEKTKLVRYPAGAVLLEPASATWVLGKFMQHARWVQADKSEKGNKTKDKPEKPIALPRVVAETYMTLIDEWNIARLTGIVETPTLYKLRNGDFKLLDKPGYDAASGLYFHPSIEFPTIPRRVDKAAARAALGMICELLDEFPFVPDEMLDDWQPGERPGAQASAARSVALSALLTGLIRRDMRAAPIHVFDANTPGTGKSYLASVITTILNGREAPAVSWVRNEEEQRKVILAELLKGSLVLRFDNINQPLGGAALNILLSEPEIEGRILGLSSMGRALTNCLVIATGNNVEIENDTTRRAVRCRMDASVERPENRRFKGKPLVAAQQRRGELVVAALTVLLAYLDAGRPERGRMKDVNGYEDWELAREALVWLDQPDPAATMQSIAAEDPTRDALLQVMNVWEKLYGQEAQLLTTVFDDARMGQLEARHMTGNVTGNMNIGREEMLKRQLADALNTAATRGRPLTAVNLGQWIKSIDGKITGNRKFLRSLNRNGSRVVALLRMSAPEEETTDRAPADAKPAKTPAKKRRSQRRTKHDVPMSTFEKSQQSKKEKQT